MPNARLVIDRDEKPQPRRAPSPAEELQLEITKALSDLKVGEALQIGNGSRNQIDIKHPEIKDPHAMIVRVPNGFKLLTFNTEAEAGRAGVGLFEDIRQEVLKENDLVRLGGRDGPTFRVPGVERVEARRDGLDVSAAYTNGHLVIGTGRQADVRIDGPRKHLMSREHAALDYEDGKLYLSNLSTKSTIMVIDPEKPNAPVRVLGRDKGGESSYIEVKPGDIVVMGGCSDGVFSIPRPPARAAPKEVPALDFERHSLSEASLDKLRRGQTIGLGRGEVDEQIGESFVNVSRLHAELRFENGEYHVSHRSSVNPTLFRTSPDAEFRIYDGSKLAPGAEIRLSSTGPVITLPDPGTDPFKKKVLGLASGEPAAVTDGYFDVRQGGRHWQIPTSVPDTVRQNRETPPLLIGESDVYISKELRAIGAKRYDEVERAILEVGARIPEIKERIKEIHIVPDAGRFLDGQEREQSRIRAVNMEDGTLVVSAHVLSLPGGLRQVLGEYGLRIRQLERQEDQARGRTILAVGKAKGDGLYSEEAQGEKVLRKYGGYPMISRETDDVRGGIYVSSGKRAPIYVPESGPLLDAAYEELRERIDRRASQAAYPDPVKREAAILDEVRRYVEKRMPYWSPSEHGGVPVDQALSEDRAARGKDPFDARRPASLEHFLAFQGGAGVCAHQALLAMHLSSRLKDEGLLRGEIRFGRNEVDGLGAHAWMDYYTESGRHLVVDPAQEKSGDVIELARRDRGDLWRYLHKEDQELFQRIPL